MVTQETQDIDLQIRTVKDEEVDHFAEHGWVMLRGFMDEQLVYDLLQRAKAILDVDSDQRYGSLEAVHVVETDPLFARFALSTRLGEIAARLLGEAVAMRRLDDRLIVKPAGETSRVTKPHQDQAMRPFKCNAIQYWVAFDEVTPAMGSMWFLNGSHKLGLLGESAFSTLEAAVERFPRLGQCQQSAQQHYGPGDVTVHHCLTVHGASVNTTERTRWGYRIAYMPADATYTGEPSIHTDGLNLTPHERPDHPHFPVVYTP